MVDPREKIKKLGVELYDHYRLNDWSLTERVFFAREEEREEETFDTCIVRMGHGPIPG